MRRRGLAGVSTTSLERLRAPLFAGLSIEHLELFNAEDRFWAQYRLDNDASAFAAKWAGFLRAAIFPSLAAALDGGVARHARQCTRGDAALRADD